MDGWKPDVDDRDLCKMEQDDYPEEDHKKHNPTTLIIGNVDFNLLEKQRLALQEAVHLQNKTPVKAYTELEGLLNMLNEWSDSQVQGE